MSLFRLDEQNALFYRYIKPVSANGRTFVFFNALTGDTSMWEGVISEQLRAGGHGVLCFNYRGQARSSFSHNLVLDTDLIVADTRALLGKLKLERVVLCGLSIGGLYALRAWLSGLDHTRVDALVLINTLRRDGPRLRWINDALLRCVEVGGLELFRDLYVPLLFNEDWQAKNREKFLATKTYTPIATDSGHYNLIKHSASVDWDLPYEKLQLPVLVVTGLQDRVFLDVNDSDALFARLPKASRIEMSDAAHLLPAERPEKLANALLDFAREL